MQLAQSSPWQCWFFTKQFFNHCCIWKKTFVHGPPMAPMS